jgi:hypothetical protein
MDAVTVFLNRKLEEEVIGEHAARAQCLVLSIEINLQHTNKSMEQKLPLPVEYLP